MPSSVSPRAKRSSSVRTDRLNGCRSRGCRTCRLRVMITPGVCHNGSVAGNGSGSVTSSAAPPNRLLLERAVQRRAVDDGAARTFTTSAFGGSARERGVVDQVPVSSLNVTARITASLCASASCNRVLANISSARASGAPEREMPTMRFASGRKRVAIAPPIEPNPTIATVSLRANAVGDHRRCSQRALVCAVRHAAIAATARAATPPHARQPPARGR